MKKKLYRSNNHRMLFGVCGGFAEYFKIDPKYIRIGYLIFTLICSLSVHFAILPVGIYAILTLALPVNPNQQASDFEKFFSDRSAYQTRSHGEQQRKIIKNVKEKDLKK